MTRFYILALVVTSIAMASCGDRGGAANQLPERSSGTPIPSITPYPVSVPMDSADVVQVDTDQEGDVLSANGDSRTRSLKCIKFDRVNINGSDIPVNIKGPCRRITVNGDRNNITADAAMEYSFNGSDNVVRYSRFVNGKQPMVLQNQQGNTIDKVPFNAGKTASTEKEKK